MLKVNRNKTLALTVGLITLLPCLASAQLRYESAPRDRGRDNRPAVVVQPAYPAPTYARPVVVPAAPAYATPVVVPAAPAYARPVYYGGTSAPGVPFAGRLHGNHFGRDGRIVVRPAISGDQLDGYMAEMFVRHSNDLSCDNLGNLLRRISNEVLSAGELPATPTEEERRRSPGSRDEFLRHNRERSLRTLLRHPRFLQSIMSRLTEAYRNCNRTCFDDGVSVGQIAGTAYCHATIGVDGLPDSGFQAQERLPVCQTENYLGCEQGFSRVVGTVDGCLAYTTGAYTSAFNHEISTECHIDQP